MCNHTHVGGALTVRHLHTCVLTTPNRPSSQVMCASTRNLMMIGWTLARARAWYDAGGCMLYLFERPPSSLPIRQIDMRHWRLVITGQQSVAPSVYFQPPYICRAYYADKPLSPTEVDHPELPKTRRERAALV